MKKKILKAFLKTVIIIVSFLGCWICAAWALPNIRVNKDFASCMDSDDCITVYIRSNGMHTDVVFPARTPERDWRERFPVENFEGVDATYDYVAVGWGDKGFYLDTPTWAELKVSTALKAMLGLSGSAMHITYLKGAPPSDEYGKRLIISKEQYIQLLHYVDDAFDEDDRGNARLIKHPDYDTNDNYYEAKGRYTIFKTCNVWTSNGLKKAGIQNGLWTPTAAGVMSSLPEECVK